MDAGIGQQTFATSPPSFCTGALASAASGYVGMWVSVAPRESRGRRQAKREEALVVARAGGFAPSSSSP